MAKGLYLTLDGQVLVDYGTRRVPISPAQYRANGYRPPCERFRLKPRPKCATNVPDAKAGKASSACRPDRVNPTAPGMGDRATRRPPPPYILVHVIAIEEACPDISESGAPRDAVGENHRTLPGVRDPRRRHSARSLPATWPRKGRLCRTGLSARTGGHHFHRHFLARSQFHPLT